MNLDYKHPLYEHYLSTWNYYSASYKGGEDYRHNSLRMLREYLFEHDAPGNQYASRLEYTALDNLTKLTVDTYRSFLFRSLPVRTFGYLQGNPLVERFLYDVDFEGQDLDDFMKEANNMAMVYGQVWILVTKGFQDGVITLEQEIENDIRPYAKIFTPENVCDWEYIKQPNGADKLVYVKTKEFVSVRETRYIEWTPEEIRTFVVLYDENGEEKTVTMTELQQNAIGEVPFVQLKANPSQYKGIGMSDIADVAKIQQALFNLLSEAEQGIRISNHPTLVKTGDVNATAGAGAVINLDNTMDPNLRPYLIEPNGTNIDSIVSMIEQHIQAFLRMTHLGAIMAARGMSIKSGIALSTEFEMLNTRLADKSAKLEQAEYNMWKLFYKWSNLQMDPDFNVIYKKTFDLRDEHADLSLLNQALQIGVESDTFRKEIHKQIARIVVENGDKLDDIMAEIDGGTLQHDPVTAETKQPHIEAMIMEGMTDKQMLELHPELTQADLDEAKAKLLENN
jgi:hypothetical protein|tara:strand:+ start:1267 stop:2790 length:1524 start_codon:yes stop_codon:yes gene_type:complete